MKTVVLYSYPPEPDGLSLQGDMLYRGMKDNGEQVWPVNTQGGLQKHWIYSYHKPDAAVGVGYWGNTPEIIVDPQSYGITAVPWFVADGWVANYQEIISALPLVFVTSEWVRKTYERDGVDTKKFVVAHIGIESEIYKPLPKTDPRIKTIRHMMGVADDEIMILTVGGDVTSKGAQEVLQALKNIGRQFKKWKYILKVWGGYSAFDHQPDEQRLIAELGEDGRKVSYQEGSFSHDFLPYLLNAADIYAAPSRLEGYGMIQVEAQACGVPVISINEMGPKETILHGSTGFLANVAETVQLTEEWAYEHMGFKKKHKKKFDKPKIFAYRANTDEIADYLLRLSTDAGLRQKMGKAAREHAVKNFEYHKLARQMTNVIKERLKLS